MSVELKIIHKLINDGDEYSKKNIQSIVESGVNEDSFNVYQNEFKWVKKFYSSYSKLPGAESFNTEFPNTPVTETDEKIDYYIDKLKELNLYNKMVELNTDMVDKLDSNKTYDALSILSERAKELRGDNFKTTDVELSRDYKKRLEIYKHRINQGVVSGIPCGWATLDDETTGWQKGEYNILTARMGSYKSWILFSWALNAWENSYSPMLISKEMPPLQVSRRLDSYVTKTSFNDLRRGTLTEEEYKKLEKQMQETYEGKHPFHIPGTPQNGEFTLDYIESKIDEAEPDILFIDGVYLFTNREKYSSDWVMHSKLSRDIKSLMIRKNIPVVATTQLNRKAANKGSNATEMEYLSYSDAYGQDADNVIGVRREKDKITDEWSNTISLDLMKVREGKNVSFDVTIDLEAMEFYETGYGEATDNVEVEKKSTTSGNQSILL